MTANLKKLLFFVYFVLKNLPDYPILQIKLQTILHLLRRSFCPRCIQSISLDHDFDPNEEVEFIRAVRFARRNTLDQLELTRVEY